MDFLFENKTFQDCTSNEYFARLFCASKKSDCLNDNQIFLCLTNMDYLKVLFFII